MKTILLILFLLLMGGLAFGQTPAVGNHKLGFMRSDQLFTFTLSDVTKIDTVGFEQFIVPEGIKPGERYKVRFEKIEMSVPVIEKIDGEAATFSANWSIHGTTTATGWHAGTIAYSNVVGSTATYTFNGTKIELFGEKTSTHGTGTVTLDGVTTQVSFKSTAKELPALIYSSPTLSPGSHTLKLTVGNGYNLIDYFSITK